jgi:trans-aconitate methyltransferase
VDLASQERMYADFLREFGPTAAAVGASERSAAMRHELIARMIRWYAPLARTLLDVGCGYGALHTFLSVRNQPLVYTGVDTCEELVAAARGRGLVARRQDFRDLTDSDRADVVVANGVLNFRLDEGDLMPALIERCYALCDRMAVVTMLSGYARQPHRAENRYYDPAEVCGWVRQVCQNFVVDHSYLPHDLAVVMLRPESLYDR